MPGHANQPIAFDGNLVTAKLQTVVEQLGGWLTSESGFIDSILARLPPNPPNYALIVQHNESGRFPEGDPTDLEAGANRCAIS